ncbi:MAG: DNA polymerase Y family protein [Myxococcota bacterium]
MSTPVIVFVEVPHFYAAIERTRHRELRGRPILVGGDPRKRGQVQSASVEAAESGVTDGMSMLAALERCPRARALRTDMRFYRDVSETLRGCLRGVHDALEPEGLNAAFLDVTPLAADPLEIGRQLRESVAQELDLELRVGIAPVRFVAQLAAREAPPSGLLRIRPGEEGGFLAPLPLERLPGVGPRAATALQRAGARTVGEVRALGRQRLEALLGNRGLRILDYAEGHDPRGVRAVRHPRSASQELTFDEPQADWTALAEALQRLARGVEESLGRHGLAARRVGVKVRFSEGPGATRTQTAPRAVASAPDLVELGLALLQRTDAGTRPVRRLGLTVTQLSRETQEDPQLDLFAGGR